MRNLEGAATSTLRNLEEPFHFILGSESILAALPSQRPLPPFSSETVDFLAALSARLSGRREPSRDLELSTFAFWCRRSHLEQLNQETDCRHRLGRGVSLHFAPSNIPLLFGYSMAAGLLAGNCVVVRLSAQETEQEHRLVRELRTVLETEFPSFSSRIVLLRCSHRRENIDYLSSLCNVRVIWGSNASVQAIRESPLPPRAIDLPFASRSSAALLDAGAVLAEQDLSPVIWAFYNDTYRNDQNACSSPALIYWLGAPETVQKAKARFWPALDALLRKQRYPIGGALAVRKLDAALQLAARGESSRIVAEGNRIIRVEVDCLREPLWESIVPGGFFLESAGETMDALCPALTSHCQTLCVYGMDSETVGDFLLSRRVTGVDRIVPLGHALDFSLTWDGFSLIEEMSRRMTRF